MPQRLSLVRLLLLLAVTNGVAEAVGRSLRRQSILLAAEEDPITADTDIKEVTTAIHEKWDKMDDFLKIMFMLACEAKHGKDVNGLAAEKLKDGSISGGEVEDFKKKTQKQNMNQLMKACGAIVAKGEGPCRERCADGFGDKMEKRNECDKKCIEAYGKFENSCQTKANNLEKVYEMKLAQASARKTCHEGHCSIFPTVWMMDDAAEQQAEVDKGCEGRCTEDAIKAACEKKWALNVDFLTPAIRTECFEKSSAKACLEEKKGTISTEEETCQTEGKGTCEEQFTECNTKGETDSTHKEGKEFCTERKKMCESQVTDSCLKKHKGALDAAGKECEKTAAEELKTCEKETLETKETEEMDACVAEKGPKCTEDCNKDCDVAKMNDCLGKLESENDAGEMFCSDFWRLLHESSEVDPSTGNPIVLLAPKANITQRSK